MSALCSIMFAGFCFSGLPINFSGTDVGTGYRVHVETGDYVAESSGTDAPIPLDWRGSHKACTDAGSCRHYWKHCNADKRGVNCEYRIYMGPNGVEWESITVTSPDETALKTAEGRIGLETGTGEHSAILKLERMTERSASPLPECDTKKNHQLCVPVN